MAVVLSEWRRLAVLFFLKSRLGSLGFASKRQDESLGFMLRLKAALPQSARRRIFMFVGT
jgi:hypothetical protein